MRSIRHVVETKAADAIIINQTQPDDERGEYLLDKGFPFATHGRPNWADQHAYYDVDNWAFADLAVRGLVKRQRKTLAVLAPPPEQLYAQELVQGAKSAAEDAWTAGEFLTRAAIARIEAPQDPPMQYVEVPMR